MNKRSASVSVIALLAGFCISAPHPFPDQKTAGLGAADEKIPAELAWITLFADDVRKNPQELWEARLKFGIEMTFIPAGEFLMGSPREEYGREPNEGPVHRVFTDGLWIGKFEITRATWQKIMGGNEVRPEERNLPQTGVSYEDCQKFLERLLIESGLKFRVPTEAEWEKCCRAGNPEVTYGPLDEIAWWAGNSGDKPHPVGGKKPNQFGLYDMLGNAWEWCSDWYDSRYYEASPILNPKGPDRGERRVERGGGFLHTDTYLRAAHRNAQDPKIGKSFQGVRLALDANISSF